MEFLNGDDWFPDKRLPVAVYHGYHVDEFPVHVHDFSELVVVTSGSAYHRVRGERYRVYPGHVFVVRSMVPHGYENAHDLKLSQIILTESFFTRHFPELQKIEGFQTLFYLQPEAEAYLAFESRMCLDGSILSTIDEQIQNLSNELATKRSGYETMSMSMLGQIVVLLCRYYEQSGPLNDSSLVGIAGATSHIQSHYSCNISIEELCEVAGMSCRSLTRHFRSTVGEPPIRYLNRVRAERSAALIRTTDLRMTEVAERVGFGDSNYFSRVFRSFFQISPRAYAREHREQAKRWDTRTNELSSYVRITP